jgi:two-component system sensor histidine kinase DegS
MCEALPWSHKVALYRVFQEALNNARKHARATSVSLLLEVVDDSVRGVVEDDGTGFDFRSVTDTSLKSGGLGLVGMRERLAALGGRLEVETSPGRGTALSVEIPVSQGVSQ